MNFVPFRGNTCIHVRYFLINDSMPGFHVCEPDVKGATPGFGIHHGTRQGGMWENPASRLRV
jgi:hypothetical protein